MDTFKAWINDMSFKMNHNKCIAKLYGGLDVDTKRRMNCTYLFDCDYDNDKLLDHYRRSVSEFKDLVHREPSPGMLLNSIPLALLIKVGRWRQKVPLRTNSWASLPSATLDVVGLGQAVGV